MKLTIEIGGIITGLNKAVESAKIKIKGLAGAFKSVTGGLFGGLAGAASVAGIVGFGKKVVDVADKIGESSKRIGVTAEEYQKLSFATQQSGTSMDALEVAFAKMFSTIQNSKNPSSKAAEALRKLGLSFKDLDGKTAFEQMRMVMAGLKGISDIGERVSIGKEILGRGSRQFSELAKNFDELTSKAGDYGTISEQATKDAEELTHTIERLEKTLISAASESGFLAYLKSIADEMEAIIKLNNGMAKKMGVQTKEEAVQDAGMRERLKLQKMPWYKKLTYWNPSGMSPEDKAAIDKKFTGAADNVTAPITKADVQKAVVEKAARDETKLKIEAEKKEYADRLSKIQLMIDSGREKLKALREDANARTSAREDRKSQEALDAILKDKPQRLVQNMEVPRISDSLIAMGAARLNPGGANSTDNITRTIASGVKTIETTLKNIDSKTSYVQNGGYAVWP